ncbi:MAG: caspase family protein [Hyphomicrobiales bacterium]|nr:caspase family protein [Hyphomicrobiales bacterium]
MLKRLAGLICVVFAVLAMAAVDPAGAANRYALVIGNAGYAGDLLGPLKNPANDAVLMSDSLKRAGFDVELVTDADLRAMKRAVQDFGKKLTAAEADAIGLFYYSGHGFQANGVNYLAPLNADLHDEVDAEFEALSVDWVLSKLEQSHKGVNVVILDACRNTALTRGMRGANEGLALLRATPRGSFISFATAPGSTASDGAGLNSPYTEAIAREILRPGTTIEAVFKNVRRSVVAATNGEQVPWDHSSLTEDVVFLPGDAFAYQTATDAGVDQSKVRAELQLWNDVKDSKSREQLQAYLDQFPEGVFAGVAQARLASLTASGLGGDVERLFAELASRAIIVEEPTRPHEFYSNARLNELKGDYPRARQDYMKYFAFGMPQVDPHYRFQNFLVIQEGRAGAREIYRSIAQGRADPTLQFASILLEEDERRTEMLTDFVAANPDFTPAIYELSREYSLSRLGQQSMSDKREEFELLRRFVERVENGRFLGYFIDQQFAAQQVQDAETRLATLSFLSQSVFKNPVTLNSSRSNQGWMMSLSIADRAREIFVALPGKDFRSTGFTQGATDPTTGMPIPYPAFELPGNAERTTIRVKYTDIRGQEQGPFKIIFDPNAELIAGQKDILQRFSTAWISYRDWNKKRLVYFTHLLSYRCALDDVLYGLDTDEPDKSFAIPACDPSNPHAIPESAIGDDIYRAIPKKTRFISVQLVFKDGTRSEVKRFDAPK